MGPFPASPPSLMEEEMNRSPLPLLRGRAFYSKEIFLPPLKISFSLPSQRIRVSWRLQSFAFIEKSFLPKDRGPSPSSCFDPFGRAGVDVDEAQFFFLVVRHRHILSRSAPFPSFMAPRHFRGSMPRPLLEHDSSFDSECPFSSPRMKIGLINGFLARHILDYALLFPRRVLARQLLRFIAPPRGMDSFLPLRQMAPP